MNCGHIAQLTQSISQLSLKPGKRRSRKRTGGNSGGDDLNGRSSETDSYLSRLDTKENPRRGKKSD